MTHRAQIDLAQLTDRLLKSRERPKRQYLIERIGRIWGQEYASARCLMRHGTTPHLHASPTPESIAAVASFARDQRLYVRIAVIVALRQKAVPDSESTPALVQMLADDHPVIRVNAARALSVAARQSLSPDLLTAALTDTTWTVRWFIAGSLASTAQSARGWETLRAAVPASNSSLAEWLRHCSAYRDRLAADDELISEICARIQTLPEQDYTRREIVTELNQLLAGPRPR